MTPAEERAADQGLPVVNVISFDLVNVASGNPMIVRTLDGGEVLLRLATADEMIAAQAAAIETLPEGMRPEPMSRRQAEELVRPLGGAR